jgi:hypothetical protein
MASIRFILLAAFALVLAIALPASAQTLYKLVDKNGKVTYSEKVPPGFDGQVSPVDIDPNRNTATLPKYTGSSDTETGAKKAASPMSATNERERRKELRVEAAKKKLEAAKAALASALENPGDTDVIRIGRVPRGTGMPVAVASPPRNVPGRGTGMPATSPTPPGPQTGTVWSDDYKARIEGLEFAVKTAEEELAAAEASD